MPYGLNDILGMLDMNDMPNVANAIPQMTINSGNIISQLMPNKSFKFYLNLFFKFALKCLRSIEDVSYTISSSLPLLNSSILLSLGSGATFLLLDFELLLFIGDWLFESLIYVFISFSRMWLGMTSIFETDIVLSFCGISKSDFKIFFRS